MVKVDLRQFNKQITKALHALDDLPKFAEKTMQDFTPIRSGNARRNTKLQGDTVTANYAYAQRLEDNYSPQTQGRGIITPTEKEIQKEVDRRLKGI